MTAPAVPFLDLAPQYAALAPDLEAAALRVLRSQQFVLGAEGRALEAELAQLAGTKHAIGCASGSDALLLILAALDVGPGDAVVTTPQSFFATAGAPARLGARVDFVDVEPGTLNLDPAALAEFLARCERGAGGALREPRQGRRVRAVITVDLFGRPCDYAALEPLCREHGLALIEDACQAIGAAAGGRRCGAFGAAAAFSFYPTKNLGGCGDGGAVTTDDDALAARMRRLRVHGQAAEGQRYVHAEVGWNSRLDELQAALLRVKLPQLASWNEARRAHAEAYDEALRGLPGIRPLDAPGEGVRATYHLYTLRAERREALRAHLAEAGVGCGVYYPLPLHLQQCFAAFGYRAGDLPQAEAASAEALSLPMYPELPEEQRARVIDAVTRFARG